jgi:hypothetical protein
MPLSKRSGTIRDSGTSIRKKKTNLRAGGEPPKNLHDKTLLKGTPKTIQQASMYSKVTKADKVMRAVRKRMTTSKTMPRTVRFVESIEWISTVK